MRSGRDATGTSEDKWRSTASSRCEARSGLGMNSAAPAFSHSAMISVVTFAERIRTGIGLLVVNRYNFNACNPETTGIDKSKSAKSKEPHSKASSAASPFSTIVTMWLPLSRISCATRWFVALSSATRIRAPRIRCTLLDWIAASACAVALDFGLAARSSVKSIPWGSLRFRPISTQNKEPFPSSLWSPIVPPIKLTSWRAIVVPKPVPP